MQHFKKFAARIWAASALATFSANADAASYVEAYTSWVFGEAQSISEVKNSSSGPVGVEAAGISPAGTGTSAAMSNSAYANFGVLKVSATVAHNYGNVSSAGWAKWYDDIIITTEQSGWQTAQVKIIVEGDLHGSGIPTSAWDTWRSTAMTGFTASTTRVGNFGITSQQSGSSLFNRVTLSGVNSSPSSVWGEYIVDFTFISGSELTIGMDALCSAFANGSSKTASCNMGHSIYWGGIVGFKQASGADATLVSITSASGTDYMRNFAPTAVPEPATWAMMIGGLGLVGASLRRRAPKLTFA